MTRKDSTPARAKQRRRPWMQAFLAVLAETGNVTRSAEAAKVQRKSAYRARDRDPDFAARWNDALDQAGDRLEGEALRRAVEGWDEPVFQRGEQVGVIRRYSDKLLIELLRAHRPARFRSRLQSGQEDVRNRVTIYKRIFLPDNGRQRNRQVPVRDA